MRLCASFVGAILLMVAILLPVPVAALESGWSTDFSPTGLDNRPLCTLETDDGLVVGGHFGTIGTEAFAYIALYDGTSWQSLGEGFNSYVQALAEFDGRIVAAGWFTASGGTSLSHVAQWDGVSWQPLGDGLPIGNRGLVVYDGALYSGGWRWNGTTWTEVLTADADVHAKLVYEGRLIVTGGFSQVNGVPVERLAAWDGETVIADYAESLEVPVYDLEVFQGQLVAYTEYPHPEILTRNGGVWATLDGQAGGYYYNPNCMATSGDRLYVMRNNGDGLHPGYSSLNIWDGVEWSGELAYSGGLYEFISPYQGGVLIAGWFDAVEDVVAHHLAGFVDDVVISFEGHSWGADGPVYDFSLGDGGLLVGGGFGAVGGLFSRGAVLHDGTQWQNRGRCGDAAGAVGWSGATPIAQTYYYSDITEGWLVYWSGTGWTSTLFYCCEEYVVDFQESGDRSYGITPSSIMDVTVPMMPQDVASATGGEIIGTGLWDDRLLVFGSFDSIDGVLVDGLALYDGESWSNCCPDLSGSVSAVTIWDGWLVIAGFLSVDRTEPNGRVVLWDGDDLTVLDDDFQGGIAAMAAYRGALFAAGHFDTVDGTVVNHIARWDGLTWQSLGEGIGTTSYGGVYDLAVHAGHLWVGGAFNYAGGHPAQNLCTWYELPLSVYLQDMQASRDHGSVCVSWTVSGEGGDFLLERINGNGTRVEVARKPATGHHHEVLDVTAPTTACRYVLHLCADDGTETVLAEVLAPATIPSALNLTSLAPNPFNPATRLAFTLPYPGIVKVTVHDLQGRTIATLLDEALSVGEHEVVWHGMDDDGHAVASGAYLVRVYAGDQHRTVKAVLVR